MFRKIKVSLSQPQLTIFFMKDKWTQILGYILFMPLFLLLPLTISSLVSTDMSVARVESLTRQLNQEFRSEVVVITDGILIGTDDISMNFDYYTIYIGRQSDNPMSLGLVFESTELVLYTSTYELRRISYTDLDLENHDFSDSTIQNSRRLAYALKTIIDQEPIIVFVNFAYVYFLGLFNYLSMVLLISLLTMLFMFNVSLPYRYRFKLSVYLTTIWVFSELLLTLFGIGSWTFISTMVVYIYHIYAYRSFKVIPKE